MDFNAYSSIEEKKGSNFHDFNNINAFNDLPNQCELLDLEFSGNRYTWSRGRVKERLDRGIGNAEWRVLFPEALIRILPPLSSDHSPSSSNAS